MRRCMGLSCIVVELRQHCAACSQAALALGSDESTLPVLAKVPAEGGADCKCTTLEGNDTGDNFNAELPCRCTTDSDAAAAVGQAMSCCVICKDCRSRKQ